MDSHAGQRTPTSPRIGKNINNLLSRSLEAEGDITTATTRLGVGG